MEILNRIISIVQSPVIDFIIKAGLIYVSALWFAMVIWVTRDVIHRSNNILFQSGMILMNLILPVFGLVLYLIVRPGKTLLEKYYEELEYTFLSEHIHEKEETCPHCDYETSAEFLYCPACAQQIKNSCHSCNRMYLHEYIVCPYCGRKDKGATGIRKKKKRKKEEKRNVSLKHA